MLTLEQCACPSCGHDLRDGILLFWPVEMKGSYNPRSGQVESAEALDNSDGETVEWRCEQCEEILDEGIGRAIESGDFPQTGDRPDEDVDPDE